MTDIVGSVTPVVLSLQQALIPKLEATALNLSSSNIPGFKALNAATYENKVMDPVSGAISFVDTTQVFVDSRQGAIQQTGNTFDVAINGEGYFQVDGGFYTRNGQFQVNAQGQLTTALGKPVKGDGGSDILIPAEAQNISIKEDGTITSSVGVLGKLGVVTLDQKTIRSVGYGLYSSKATPEPSKEAKFIQGALEGSNVESITEIVKLTEIQRQFEQAVKAMDLEDERRKQTINVSA